jgi:GGDEF domain-containing protein
LTVSFGVAVFPDDGTNWESVLAAADKALYLAKQTCSQTATVKEKVNT